MELEDPFELALLLIHHFLPPFPFLSAIWSRPLPLGWFFSEQWRRFQGNNWVEKMCDRWIARDRLLKNFANELPMVRRRDNIWALFQKLLSDNNP